jgi:hypothetical protein
MRTRDEVEDIDYVGHGPNVCENYYFKIERITGSMFSGQIYKICWMRGQELRREEIKECALRRKDIILSEADEGYTDEDLKVGAFLILNGSV